MSYFVKGIDVSKWDGGSIPYTPLNWDMYTWDFAFIKVSEGWVIDPLFVKQWQAAKNKTIRGPYHFFRPSEDPKISVSNTLNFMAGDLGELPMALDLESIDGRGDTGARARVWVEEYENKTNKQPIIYSSPNFLNNILKASQFAWLADYKLWLAEYYYDLMSPDASRDQRIRDVLAGKIDPVYPRTVAPFTLRMPFWQWTSRLKPEDVPGYYMGPGHKLAVDGIFYQGTRQEFEAEFKVSGPIVTPPGGDEDMGITAEMWAQLLARIDGTNVRLDKIQSAIEDLDIVSGGNDGQPEPPPGEEDPTPVEKPYTGTAVEYIFQDANGGAVKIGDSAELEAEVALRTDEMVNYVKALSPKNWDFLIGRNMLYQKKNGTWALKVKGINGQRCLIAEVAKGRGRIVSFAPTADPAKNYRLPLDVSVVNVITYPFLVQKVPNNGWLPMFKPWSFEKQGATIDNNYWVAMEDVVKA